jgi:hypothetical protein
MLIYLKILEYESIITIKSFTNIKSVIDKYSKLILNKLKNWIKSSQAIFNKLLNVFFVVTFDKTCSYKSKLLLNNKYGWI